MAHDPVRGRRHQLGARSVRPSLRRPVDGRPLARVHVPLAAVHDPADLRRARADPELVPRGVGRSRRALVHDVHARDPAARVPGDRRRLDLHVLPDARRLHRAGAHHERAVHRDGHLLDPRRGAADRRGVLAGARSSSSSSTCSSRDGSGRSRASDGRVARHADPAAARRARDAGVHLPAAVHHRALRVQQERHAGVADREVQHQVVLGRVQRSRRPRCAQELAPRGDRGDGHRARPGHARVDGGRALPLLRSRDDHVRGDPPDRASRDRHRARAAGDDHRRPRAARRHLRSDDDHHRARDLLHRRDLQQRDRAHAPYGRLARRGVGRPRRRQLADVPVRDAPADADRAARGWLARVRALVRRGHRHDLHVGREADAARSGSSRRCRAPTSCRS